jgi:hypothetical protein
MAKAKKKSNLSTINRKKIQRFVLDNSKKNSQMIE